MSGGIRYPGGKMAAGAREQIIRAMPPHRVYVEPFLGGGAVFFTKRPAARSIIADRDEEVLRYLRSAAGGDAAGNPAVSWLVADALTLLPSLPVESDWLVYCDPPYHPASRTSGDIYKFEMTDADHARLLDVLRALPCMVMLSGYRCALYDERLSDWRRVDYRAMTRGGVRVESLWMNFEPYKAHHDLRYVGKGFRERERIKRKRARWVKRLRAMEPGERAVLVEALAEVQKGAAAGVPIGGS